MAQSEVADGPGMGLKSRQRIVEDGAKNDEGYVYCIAEYDKEGQETGYIKVGTAYEPEKRLKRLQTSNVRQLKIWKDCKVSKRLDAETAAHNNLAKYRVNLGGGTEWFMVPPSEQDKFYELFCEATEQYLTNDPCMNTEPRVEKDGASNDEGDVYCIAECDKEGKETGYIKVGTAYDPEQRRKELQTGNARQLKIWRNCQFRVSKRLDAEKAAHKDLEKYKANLRGGTEWFMVPPNEWDKFRDLFCKATEQYRVK